MKRSRFLFAVCLLVVGGMLLSTKPALAKKPYSIHSLNGTYYYVFTQARLNDAGTGIAHCSGFGTIDFFGDGTGEIHYNDQCDGEFPLDTGTHNQTYTVSGDGVVIITNIDVGPEDNTQCQLVDKGKIMLCDGSTRTTSDHRSFIAIGVKQ